MFYFGCSATHDVRGADDDVNRVHPAASDPSIASRTRLDSKSPPPVRAATSRRSVRVPRLVSATGEQAFDRDVFIQPVPVDAARTQLEVCPLLWSRVQQPWEPSKRHADDPAVVKRHPKGVVIDCHAFRRMCHAKPFPKSPYCLLRFSSVAGAFWRKSPGCQQLELSRRARLSLPLPPWRHGCAAVPREFLRSRKKESEIFQAQNNGHRTLVFISAARHPLRAARCETPATGVDVG